MTGESSRKSVVILSLRPLTFPLSTLTNCPKNTYTDTQRLSRHPKATAHDSRHDGGRRLVIQLSDPLRSLRLVTAKQYPRDGR